MKRFISFLLAILLLYTLDSSYEALAAWPRASREQTGSVLLEGEAAEAAPAPEPAAAETTAPTPAPAPAPTPEPADTPAPEESPDPADTPTPEDAPEPTPEAARQETAPESTPEPTPEPEPQGWREGYYIMVNVQANTVNIYSSDENGAFTVPVRAMICSTGADTPTSGVYRPGWRLRWQTLFGNVYGQYVTQIVGNILFHSVPYTEYGNKGSLEYWEFDQLGTSCSMGCVRLQVIDAKWIYDNMYSIVGIEFYSASDPGPLGRPGAPTISGNERCRGWDPTDPDPANPWLTDEPESTPEPTPEPTPTPDPAALPPEEEILIGSGEESDPAPTPEPTPEPKTEPESGGEDDVVIIEG